MSVPTAVLTLTAIVVMIDAIETAIIFKADLRRLRRGWRRAVGGVFLAATIAGEGAFTWVTLNGLKQTGTTSLIVTAIVAAAAISVFNYRISRLSNRRKHGSRE